MPRVHFGWVLIGLLVGCSALAQDRSAQIGTKICEGGYAAAVDVTIPMNDPKQAEELMRKSFDDLTSMAQAEGFTMLGPFRIMMKTMAPTPDQKIPFQLQMLFIEEPTADDLQAQFGFSIVKLEPQKVAYTYHKGSLDQVATTIMGLLGWIAKNNLQISGPPWMVVYLPAGEGEPQLAELQVPVQ